MTTESPTTDGAAVRSSDLLGLRPYHEESAVTIYHGDCRQIVPMLGNFDLLLTDPPYGLNVDRTMSKQGGTQYGKAAADYQATLSFLENRVSSVRKALRGD